MEKTPTKTGLPSNLEKYLHNHWPTSQTATLLNENKRIYKQMHQRHKPKM